MHRLPFVVRIVLLGCLLVGCAEDMTSEEHLHKANALFEKGHYRPAIVEFKSSLSLDPNQVQARVQLGRAYYEIGDFTGADKELSRSLEFDGAGVDRGLVVPTLAQTLLQIGDYRRLAALDISGLQGEGRSTALAAQGLALLFQGEDLVAGDVLRAANEMPEPSLFAQVALARLDMASEDYAGARQKLDPPGICSAI